MLINHYSCKRPADIEKWYDCGWKKSLVRLLFIHFNSMGNVFTILLFQSVALGDLLRIYYNVLL